MPNSNKVMKYILVDDDMILRESTFHFLELVPNCVCLASCENSFEAIQAMQIEMPDVLILDVEMPGLSGIQFAKSLTQVPLIIFISSHPHYALEAFDVDAIDYLVKPIIPERLIRTMEKARHLIELKKLIPNNDGFQKADENSFFIKEKSEYVRIQYEEVLYIESMADFVNIFLKTGEKKIALVNLKNLEAQLPSSYFLRISRTNIVNVSKITALDSNSIRIDNIQLPIGKSFQDDVMKLVLKDSLIKRHS